MNKPNWDDRKIEIRLKELPNVKDQQTKDHLYNEIKNRIEMEEERSRVKRSKPVYRKQWFFPSLASAAALLIILLIIPSFMPGDDYSSENSQLRADQKESGVNNIESDLNDNRMINEFFAGNDSDIVINAKDNISDDDLSASLERKMAAEAEMLDLVAIPYVEDVQMGDIWSFHVMVAGVERESLVDIGETQDEILFNILSNNQQTWAANIEGLQKVEVDEAENAVTLDFVSATVIEGLSSSESVIYRGAIREILSVYGFEKVYFTADGQPGVMIGQTGVLEYMWDLPFENRGYYLYTNGNGEEFFLRGVSISEWSLGEEGKLSFSETLEKMRKVKENAWYEPTIPGEVQINDIKEEEGEATITITEDSAINDKIIETIRLTASDFSLDYVTIIKDRVKEVIKTIKVPEYPIPFYESRQ